MSGILRFERFACSSSAPTIHSPYPYFGLAFLCSRLRIPRDQSQFPVPVTATAILSQKVVLLLANLINQTLPGPLPTMPDQNSQNTLPAINALRFLSFVFSRAYALSATLIQQWSRIYLQGRRALHPT